jgi:hypothetical protein
LILQYDRTVRQFSEWRAFVRNAAQSEITVDQIADVPDIVATVVNELKTPDAEKFIDPVIPESLRGVESPIVEIDAVQKVAGKQLADDLLESINNIFKRVAELALALETAVIGPTSSWVVGTARQSAEAFGKEAQKSIVKEFGKLGRDTGPAVGRFLRRLAKLAIFGGITAKGGSLLLPHLFASFPNLFGWLEPVLRFLKIL